MNWNWLPAFIVEKLKEIERKREIQERPQLHVPTPVYPEYIPEEPLEEDDTAGVVIIDMNTYEIIDEEI